MAEIVFRTSGSTGEPKSIVRDSGQLDADARSLVKQFPFLSEGTPRYLASIRSEHFFGALWRDRVPRFAGSEIDEAVIVSVEELVAKSVGGGRFVFVTTPSFLDKALAHPDFTMLNGRFAAVITSGSALRRETALAVTAVLGVCPCEIYGSTEAGTIAWRQQSVSPLLKPVAGVETSCDEAGRLVVKSPFAMANPLVTGDLVRFADSGEFELLGRADRLVKVLEKYVSLSSVERAFEAHPLIAAARAETMMAGGGRIGVVVTLTGEGRAEFVRGAFADFAARLRRDLIGAIGAVGYPRRIRFVRELPVDGRGKCTAAAVREVLARNCREPVVTAWSATAESLAATLVFTADLECFDGHFPGYPILAGVAQLYFLRHFARQAFPDFPDGGTYRKLKFRRLVRPGESVLMKVERRGTAFAFELSVDGETAASGQLEGQPS